MPKILVEIDYGNASEIVDGGEVDPTLTKEEYDTLAKQIFFNHSDISYRYKIVNDDEE